MSLTVFIKSVGRENMNVVIFFREMAFVVVLSTFCNRPIIRSILLSAVLDSGCSQSSGKLVDVALSNSAFRSGFKL